MPFINGRYYVNPIMGEALEAAREAEAALAALENRAQQTAGGDTGEDDGDGFDNDLNGRTVAPRADADGPIHRVEIEAAEMVPAHSGRAARGYVARVHRQPSSGTAAPRNNSGQFTSRSASASGQAETHVFADHRDLVSFLRDELAKDSHSHGGPVSKRDSSPRSAGAQNDTPISGSR